MHVYEYLKTYTQVCIYVGICVHTHEYMCVYCVCVCVCVHVLVHKHALSDYSRMFMHAID